MNKTQEHFAIEEAQSEIRTRVLEIRALPDDKLTPELKAERDTLDQKYAAGEVKFRASLKSLREGQEEGVTLEDGATRELRQLEQKASMGDIAAGVLTQHACEGASRELQQHHHLKPNQVPLSLLRSPVRGKAYLRAITPGPTNSGRG